MPLVIAVLDQYEQLMCFQWRLAVISVFQAGTRASALMTLQAIVSVQLIATEHILRRFLTTASYQCKAENQRCLDKTPHDVSDLSAQYKGEILHA